MWPTASTVRHLHFVAAFVQFLWVILAGLSWPAHEVSVPITFSPVTFGLRNGSDTVVHHEPPRTDYAFHSLRVLIAFPAVTGAFHLFYAFNLPRGWVSGYGSDHNYLRWIEYSVSATLLTVCATVGVGLNDWSVLALVVGHSVAMQAAGLGIDVLMQGRHKVRWMRELLLGTGFLNLAVVVAAISRAALAATAPPGAPLRERNVAAVYGIYYCSFGVACVLRAYKKGPWRASQWTELAYVILSLSSKTSVFWMSFAGTQAMLAFFHPEYDGAPVDWVLVTQLAEYLPLGLAVLGFGACWARFQPPPRLKIAGTPLGTALGLKI